MQKKEILLDTPFFRWKRSWKGSARSLPSCGCVSFCQQNDMRLPPGSLLLLLLLCLLRRCATDNKCSSEQMICVKKVYCPWRLYQPPPSRCGSHPTRVCCHKENSLAPPKPVKCGLAFGKPVLEGLLIGGVDVLDKKKWPWMVAIMKVSWKKHKPVPVCTGFLIDKRHVLTAAHCFPSSNPTHYIVRVGEVLLSKGKIVRVSRILIHPRYHRKQFHDDVALLTLARDLPHAMPVCLPPPTAANHSTPVAAGRSVTVVGWGATRTNGPMSEKLQELKGLPLVPPSECEALLKDFIPDLEAILPNGLEQTMMCAGKLDMDTCIGDSGGPLMVQREGRWYAVGIVAFGTTKCAVGAPGVYTSIAHYVDWIEKNKE